ncbi:hypothetical protein [Methylophilus sp. OH31]|uniref:hypothetical protein n=1 Tax=Methylophilus sp. OH31 TaxID=1387312 RepID=UPI000464D127|nr:hypothetical protein [Methylophilus sp. OH31]
MKTNTAKVIRVTEGGVVYAKDPTRPQVAGFDFGKIVNYHGESAQELKSLGLRVGQEVSIEYDDRNLVNSVWLKP